MKEIPWHEAKASQNADTIILALLSGTLLYNLSENIAVRDNNDNVIELPVISIVLSKGDFDTIPFLQRKTLAEDLLNAGVPLPACNKPRETFGDNLVRWFSHLARNTHDLFITLYLDPSVVTLRDSNDETVLFYAAGEHNIRAIQLLAEIPGVDFNAISASGHTSLVDFILRCSPRQYNVTIFCECISIFCQRNANFDDIYINNDGRWSVLHFLTMYLSREQPTLALFLDTLAKNKKSINLNIMDIAGRTALWHAVERDLLSPIPLVPVLLKAGANPAICARANDPECDLFAKIEHEINDIKTKLNEASSLKAELEKAYTKDELQKEYEPQQAMQYQEKNIAFETKRLRNAEKIRGQLTYYPVAAIRKNARIMGQALRTKTGTLFKLPVELLKEIAGMTGGIALSEAERRNVARESFSKPT